MSYNNINIIYSSFCQIYFCYFSSYANRQKPKNFCLFLIPPITTTFKNRFSNISPACIHPPDFLWKRSRNSWPAGNCVMSKNPLSERSELWIFVNDLSSFRQALEFRSAATESPEGACARGVHENQTILFPASGLNLLLSYSSTLLIGTLTNLLYSFFPCKVLIYPQI